MPADFLDLDFAVSPQIEVEELERLKAEGFQSIFCHRPDQEDEDQTPFAEIAKRAEALGLKAYHLPVVPNQITDQDHAAFKALIDAAPKPILAYCKTGGRAKILWNAAHPQD
ncbi:MAG: TIGR01244 family sulfur transferase [Pseudomonadota bacterium]